MRASAVVKRQRTWTARSFRSCCQAATSRHNSEFDAIRRSKHCRASTLNSISATFSQLPCLGVWWISSRSAIRRACSGGNTSYNDASLWVFRLSGLWRHWLHHFADQLLAGLVQGDQRPLFVVGPVVDLQHVLHGADELGV